MSSRMALRGAVGVGVSGAAVMLLLGTVDLSAAAQRLAAIQPEWLLIAPIMLTAQLAIRSRRWALLLTTMSGAPVRTRRLVGPLTVGYLANALLPARLGEVARSVLVARREVVAIGLVLASVVAERVLDLAALLAVGIATTGVATIGWPAVAATAALVVGLTTLIALAPVLTRWVTRLAPAVLHVPMADFLGGLRAVGPRTAIVAAGLSALAWFGDVGLMWGVARALGVELSLSAAAGIAVGAALGTALPAAGGYIGTYEIGAVALGSLAGVPADTVLAIAVLAHILAVVPVALVGAIAMAGTGLPLSRVREEAAAQVRVVV